MDNIDVLDKESLIYCFEKPLTYKEYRSLKTTVRVRGNTLKCLQNTELSLKKTEKLFLENHINSKLMSSFMSSGGSSNSQRNNHSHSSNAQTQCLMAYKKDLSVQVVDIMCC